MPGRSRDSFGLPSLPSYLVASSRWLVRNPEQADPAGRFKDPDYNRLWTPVWTGRLALGVELTAHAGGMIQFDAEPAPSAPDSSVDPSHTTALDGKNLLVVMNAFEYCLCVTCAKLSGRRLDSAAISSAHVLRLSRRPGGPMMPGFLGKGLLEDARWYLTARPTVAGGHPPPVTPPILDAATQLLNLVSISAYPKSVELLALTNRATAAYREHTFDESLILAWSVAEVCQSSLWDDYISEAAVRHDLQVNKKRREKLHGRDYTASVVSESLCLAGVIPDEFKAKMDRVRRARNDWVHGLKDPTAAICTEALEVATELYGRVVGVTMPPPSL